MHFEPNTIYHIYNQGNNRQRIFFKHENYLFFLKKAREYVSPYADFLCYCLMPNHFDWLVYVRETERVVCNDGVAASRPVTGVPPQPSPHTACLSHLQSAMYKHRVASPGAPD